MVGIPIIGLNKRLGIYDRFLSPTPALSNTQHGKNTQGHFVTSGSNFITSGHELQTMEAIWLMEFCLWLMVSPEC